MVYFQLLHYKSAVDQLDSALYNDSEMRNLVRKTKLIVFFNLMDFKVIHSKKKFQHIPHNTIQ